MQAFRENFAELSRDLERIENLLMLIKSLRDFGMEDLGKTERPQVDAVAAALWTQAQERRTDLPLISGSLVLYMAGRFEYFAKSLVSITADEIAESCSRFDDLPAPLQRELINKTAEVALDPRKYGFDDARRRACIIALAENFGARENVRNINSSVLAITDANLRPRPLADLFKRVGVTDLLSRVGKQTKMQAYFESNDEAFVNRSVDNKLNEIMDERNNVAHPTGSVTFPGPDQVLEHIRFLRILSETLSELLQVHVSSFRKSMSDAVDVLS